MIDMKIETVSYLDHFAMIIRFGLISSEAQESQVIISLPKLDTDIRMMTTSKINICWLIDLSTQYVSFFEAESKILASYKSGNELWNLAKQLKGKKLSIHFSIGCDQLADHFQSLLNPAEGKLCFSDYTIEKNGSIRFYTDGSKTKKGLVKVCTLND